MSSSICANECQTFSSFYKINSCRFATKANNYIRKEVDTSVSLTSLDGHCKLTLSPHEKFINVQSVVNIENEEMNKRYTHNNSNYNL